jgi:hypothetical protein
MTSGVFLSPASVVAILAGPERLGRLDLRAVLDG